MWTPWQLSSRQTGLKKVWVWICLPQRWVSTLHTAGEASSGCLVWWQEPEQSTSAAGFSSCRVTDPLQCRQCSSCIIPGFTYGVIILCQGSSSFNLLLLCLLSKGGGGQIYIWHCYYYTLKITEVWGWLAVFFKKRWVIYSIYSWMAHMCYSYPTTIM